VIESLNRQPASPRCGEFEELIMVSEGPKRCLVGNTETMKGMGRAGRVNVKRKDVETARAINQALLR
jgi:hypothetical protein